jgi:hypothetical protein
MPKRENKKQEKKEYGYVDLLLHIRTVIDEEYGGVAKFIESDKFVEIGFEDSKSEKSKFHTYMACQTDKTKTVKSFPVLRKLYKGLLNIELESKIVRTQVILAPKPIF